MSLTYLGDQITIYSGSAMLLAGVIGNGMNIFIFSTTHTYRTTPLSFYYLIGSIDNMIYILIFLITRIATAIIGIDLTFTSLIWCKARAFFTLFLAPISFTCSCLATIDQFFVTSQNVNLRLCSNIKWAHRIIIIAIIVWFIHGIFAPVFYNITPIRCGSTNAVYADYATIYPTVILCAIPVLIMVVFGCLAYRNIRLTIVLVAQHADRQLTKMILIQVLLVVISIMPYGINSAYRLITVAIPKSIDRQVEEAFITTMVSLVSYLYYIVCVIFSL
jgi:hypothetical protein